MRAELQNHLVKADIDIRMVIGSLSFSGDSVHKLDAL
jgi:hypothetical protein